jgi:hypothetical protein
MADWSRPFEDTITLTDGRTLSTLRDAGDFITSLPKVEQQLEEWQTAIEYLIGAAEYRDYMMHARIAALRALNRHVDRTFNPDRKDTQWGKRELKRDQ